MIRVIIVDDEILSRIGLQSFIDGKEDITVEKIFEDPVSAIDYLVENPVDIVLTDIEMADMSGLDFIKVIRDKKLADGVIIVSCHDDFSYAQKAISNGTDSYLLKHNVTEESLISEVHAVYEKISKKNRTIIPHGKDDRSDFGVKANAVYRVAVIRVRSSDGSNMVDSTMLVHLLEDLIARNEMGTIFSPYNKEIFVIFQFPENTLQEEADNETRRFITVIDNNVRQYISGTTLYGISQCFRDLTEVNRRYLEAEDSLTEIFYRPGQRIFFHAEGCSESSNEIKKPVFSSTDILRPDGLEEFMKTVRHFLSSAEFYHVTPSVLKSMLIHSLIDLLTTVLKENQAYGRLQEKYLTKDGIILNINGATSQKELETLLYSRMNDFIRDMKEELDHDDLLEALIYIDHHLQDKISLNDLTAISHMSIPTFSKKFKDRTGMTLIQYLNERRIAKACILLQNQNYTLSAIAEETGFSNENYLVRVFKKVKGQTVSDYRKEYGISTESSFFESERKS